MSDSPAAETAAQTGDRSVAVSTEEQRRAIAMAGERHYSPKKWREL